MTACGSSKALWGRGCTTPHIRNFGTRWRIYDRDDDNNSLQSVIYLWLQAIKKLGEEQFDTTIFNAPVQHVKGHTADTIPTLPKFYIKWEQFLHEWKAAQ